MPGPGPDQRSRNRRPRRRGPSSFRAPVSEWEEQQELEAARERNDLAITDLREMSVNELRQVGRELELDTGTGERKDELVDRILPDVPYRQWVLSLPWELRTLCARRADVLTAVARKFWQSLRVELRSKSGVADPEPGGVTFVQRFGGSLNLNVHMHVVAADGVLALSEAAGLLGKRVAPLLPPWGTGTVAGPLRALGVQIPDELLNQLRFGRGLDNRRYKASGFEYGYTSRETVVALAKHMRLHPILRGIEHPYTYEGEVERFLRRSPLTRPPEPPPEERTGTEREPFGI